MEYATRKARAGAKAQPVSGLVYPMPQPVTPAPVLALRPLAQVQAAQSLMAHTLRPVAVQRQQIGPAFQALSLHRESVEGLSLQRQAVQGQVQQLQASVSANSVTGALQRRAIRQAPVAPLTGAPASPSEWVRAARLELQRVADPARPEQTRWLGGAERERHLGTLRGVGQGLAQGFKTDRGPALQRYAEYGEALATLQRQSLMGGVVRTVMQQTSPTERPPLQRATDEAAQRQASQEAQDASALNLHSLQRQLADLDTQAEQPILERVQARRGGGDPLPSAVRRQLEAGLNHDLSGVRLHTDGEADLLSKKVNAVAFTTGSDIYFQSGRFDPNSQTGIELLAHEATHTVQQGKGQVGKGIDPDAGLEAEARSFGTLFASSLHRSGLGQQSSLGQKAVPKQKALPTNPYAPGVYTPQAALGRVKEGAVQAAIHRPLAALQRQPSGTVQRFGWGDLNPVKAIEKGADWAADQAKGAITSGLNLLPGYHELCMTFGKDLVTGKAMAQNPDAILNALADWVPGSLKDIIHAVRESGAMPKAWAWFQGELGKLNMGGLLGEIGGAIKSLSVDKAKQAILGRVNTLKGIITGSARRIADIVLTAISAGLGPVGAKIMAGLRQGGDVVVQVLKNPAKFASNLLNALKQGFGQFGQHAGQHFENGVGGWLTGATGVPLPPKLDLPGIFMTALSVMHLTYANFRGRLVKAVGEGKVKLAEGSISMMQTLRGGLQKDPGMKGSEGAVGSEVLTGIKNEVQTSLIFAGIKKVVSMLIPGGGFITALLGAFGSCVEL